MLILTKRILFYFYDGLTVFQFKYFGDVNCITNKVISKTKPTKYLKSDFCNLMEYFFIQVDLKMYSYRKWQIR